MTAETAKLKRGAWVRFQNQKTRIVLEGFVQDIDKTGGRILVARSVDWPESQWHSLADIVILKHQEH